MYKYLIWDNDNAVNVCNTDSKKEAFKAILAHLIDCDCNPDYVSDPIMWSSYCYKDAEELIEYAHMAYNRMKRFIPIDD